MSIREAALLQTFPLWFEFNRTIWSGHYGIGNSVMPCVAKAIGDRIVKAMGIDTTRLEIKKLPPSDIKFLQFNHTEAIKYWNKKKAMENSCSLKNSSQILVKALPFV